MCCNNGVHNDLKRTELTSLFAINRSDLVCTPD